MTTPAPSDLPEDAASSVSYLVLTRNWVHVYEGKKSLVDNAALRAGGLCGGVEFFTSAGQRLAPVLGPGLAIRDLVETGDEPDPDLIRRRIRALLQKFEDYCLRRPEEVEPYLEPEEVPAYRLRRLDTVLREAEPYLQPSKLRALRRSVGPELSPGFRLTPTLDDGLSLDDLLARCADLIGPHDQGDDSGGWLHNLCHAVGGDCH